MSNKSKIVDLVVSEDGSYKPKRERNKNIPNSKGKGLIKVQKDEKPKYLLDNSADEFLSGIDAGLDLIENIIPRVERFLRLRG